MTMMNGFWKGKRVLVTGHTGFKGSWLSIWLHEMGAKVLGIGLKPRQELDNFCVSGIGEKIGTAYRDICDFDGLTRIFREFQPEVVLHLAAQALVGTAYEQPRQTFEATALGTLYVLEAVRNCDSVKAAVLITSDKCYKNKEQIWGYRETDTLGGDDPYSASKGCAELIINSYIRCYFSGNGALVASARAGNVVGGGDWSKNRIVPDCFRSLFAARPILLRNPSSIRPWQFVLEPLRGYLMLAERLYNGLKDFSGSWNFGPSLEEEHSVSDVANGILKHWGKGEVAIQRDAPFHESVLLQLDCTKARKKLGWRPVLSFDETVGMTTAWYRQLFSLARGEPALAKVRGSDLALLPDNPHEKPKEEMYVFCIGQIRAYERKLSHESE